MRRPSPDTSTGPQHWAFTLLLLLGLLCGWAVPVGAAEANAAGNTNNAHNARARFATVLRVQGLLSADGAALSVGDAVWVGQRLRAEASAEALLRTDDAGLIALRPGAELLAERFAARGQADDHQVLRLLRGGLRLVTGWIGRTRPQNDVLYTPTTTVGIRGTDHEPYVLTQDLAETLAQPEGTYDKVNRGGTTLSARGGAVDVEPGQVGFARVLRRRALLTLVLPVLLEKVPTFFVPGAFDAELERLAAEAELAPAPFAPIAPMAGNAATPEATTRPAETTPAQPGTSAANNASPTETGCRAQELAGQWLVALDSALQRRDTPTVLRLFAPDVRVSATVRENDGATSRIELTPDEFARSSASALEGLRDYSQRRISLEARPQATISCARIVLRSVVIEQGKQGQRAFRFEAVEDYVLEQRGTAWIAIEARTLQR